MAAFPLDNFFSFSPMQGLGRPEAAPGASLPLSGARTPTSEISSVSSPPVLQRLLLPQPQPQPQPQAQPVTSYFYTPQGTPMQPPVFPHFPPAMPTTVAAPTATAATASSGHGNGRTRSHFAEALEVVNEAERLRTELLFILKFPITAPTTPTISRSSPVGGKSQQTPAFPSERPPSKSPKKRGFKSPFSDVPENFQRALEAVETHGFGAIRWAEGWSALHWATQAGRPEICEWLLERGGDPQLADRKGKTPLGLAQELQDTNVKGKQVLRLLAEAAGIDPAKEEKERNLLTTMPTVQSGRVTATTTTTTTSNSIPSSRRENAFPNFPHLPEAYEEALRAIHRHGWSALKWSAGWSALHWAAQEGRLDVVKYLVDTAKAPVDITDKAGRQPIFYAARRGHSNVTVFLQSRGAKDVQGDVTPE